MCEIPAEKQGEYTSKTAATSTGYLTSDSNSAVKTALILVVVGIV